MWLLIFILFFISYLLSRKLLFRDYYSRLIANMYVLLWILPLSISTFHPYGLNEISDECYLILLLNVFCFLCGFSIVKCNKDSTINIGFLKQDCERIIKNPYFVVFLILAGVCYLYQLKTGINAYSYYGNHADVRNVYYGEMFSSQRGLKLFLTSIIGISSYIYILIIGCYLFFLKKKTFISLLLLLFLLSTGFVSGGRIGYVKIFLMLMLIFFFKKRPFQIKQFLFICFALGTVYLLVSYISMSRARYKIDSFEIVQDGFEYTNKAFVRYFVGPCAAFNYALKNDYLSVAGGYQYGTSTFLAFDRLTALLLKSVGYNHDVSLKRTGFYNDVRISLGDDEGWSNWNALYTSALPHYFDFGVIGIIFFSFLWGIVIRSLIWLLYKHSSFFCSSFLIYMLAGLLFSEIAFYPIREHDAIFCIFFILYLFYSTKKNDFIQARSR